MTKDETTETIEQFKTIIPPDFHPFLSTVHKWLLKFKPEQLQNLTLMVLPDHSISIECFNFISSITPYTQGSEILEINIHPSEPKCQCLYILYRENQEPQILTTDQSKLRESLGKQGVLFEKEVQTPIYYGEHHEFKIKNDFPAIKRCILKFQKGEYKKDYKDYNKSKIDSESEELEEKEKEN